MIDAPFSYLIASDGCIRIKHQGRVVKTLAGPAADRLRQRLERATAQEVQMALARVTGNFKRGNERR